MFEAVGEGRGGLLSEAAMNSLDLLVSKPKCRVHIPFRGLENVPCEVTVQSWYGGRFAMVSATCKWEGMDRRLTFTVLDGKIISSTEWDFGGIEIFLNTIVSIEDMG